MLRFIGVLILIIAVCGCDKGVPGKSYDYLNLRIEGEEQDVPWEHLTSFWDHNNRTLEIRTSGYQQRKFDLVLTNISDTGSVFILSLLEMNYADGVLFVPDSVYGEVFISEISPEHIRGSFTAFFSDFRTNNHVQLHGDFGSFIGE